jgi:hypothetical protein
MSDITSMMIASDNRTLDLPSLATDSNAFQIAYNLKHLPANFQPVLSSDVDKVAAFLPTFFVKTSHPQGFDFCYAYTIRQTHQMTVLTILTHKQPETAADFFALALAINNQSHYYENNFIVNDENHAAVTEHDRKMFIYSLLQDAALCGHPQAIKALANLAPDAQANNYLCVSQFNFTFNYNNTNKFFLLSVALTTPAEFFDLANETALASKLMVYTKEKIHAADNSQLNEIIYSLLSDAAKAGHAAAKDQLIAATIAGNAAARKFVTFARYNPELSILLPRQFVSAEDFYKLSISLITHGKHILGSSCSLEGPFYIVPEGRNAERLGYLLRNRADSIKRAQEEARKALVRSAQLDEAGQTKQVSRDEAELPGEETNHWASLWSSIQPGNHSSFFFAEGKPTTRLLDLEIEESQCLGIKNR